MVKMSTSVCLVLSTTKKNIQLTVTEQRNQQMFTLNLNLMTLYIVLLSSNSNSLLSVHSVSSLNSQNNKKSLNYKAGRTK